MPRRNASSRPRRARSSSQLLAGLVLGGGGGAIAGAVMVERLAAIESQVRLAEQAVVAAGAVPSPPLTAAVSTIVAAAGGEVRCERFELGWTPLRATMPLPLAIRVEGTASSRGDFERFEALLDGHRFLGGVREARFDEIADGPAGWFALELGGGAAPPGEPASILAAGSMP